MAENTGSMPNPEEGTTVSIVAVPEELRERVRNYVRQLEEDTDTSAHMLSRGGSALARSTIASTNFTGTNCRYVKTGGGWDIACADVNP